MDKRKESRALTIFLAEYKILERIPNMKIYGKFYRKPVTLKLREHRFAFIYIFIYFCLSEI